MIKIRVNTLPDAGFDLDQKVSADSINERLAAAPDSNTNKIDFADPLEVKLHVEKVPHGMTAEGEVKANCTQACSRCADFVTHPVACSFSHVFKHHNDPSSAAPEDDIGVSYYTGEHVEMAPVIEDLLILNLSAYWHPEDDADGRCSHCKINLKERKKKIKIGTQGLGDALKKAGIK